MPAEQKNRPSTASSDELQPREFQATDQVLRVTLSVPFECAFVKPGSVNGLPTYSVPPLTTIRGMIYNALGRPSLLMQRYHGTRSLPKDTVTAEVEWRTAFEDRTRIGLRQKDSPIEATHLRSIYKREDSSKKDKSSYYRAIANADVLVRPTYMVYIGVVDENDQQLLETISAALDDPQRPLYLGRSDDLVIVESTEILPTTTVNDSAELTCVIPGIGDQTEMLPIISDTIESLGKPDVPATVRTVSISGGSVTEYVETIDGDRFVYLD